jgi:hypothetical protein
MNNFKKGGRPEIEIKRDKSKLIYFTNAEFEQLNKMLTQGEYQNMNDMIRGILLNNQYKIITLDFDERIQRNILIEEARRIGNNFNQLLKHFNQKKMDHFTKEEISILNTNIIQIKTVYDKIEQKISS